MLMQIDGLLKVIKDERIVMMLNHIRYSREASKRSLKALKNKSPAHSRRKPSRLHQIKFNRP